jgi:tight adherence protein B
MSLLAAAAAAVAVALLFGGAATRSERSRFGGMTGSTRPGPPRGALIGVTAVGAAGLVFYADGRALALGMILLGAVLGAGRLAAAAHRRRSTVRREERVLEICEALAGELRSGQPPTAALHSCAAVWPEFEPVAAAASFDVDVTDALRQLGERPGAGGLRLVASAWHVSRSSGAALTVALTQVAESARQQQATRRIVASELASAQATARLVAGLPVVALLMGGGGDPWRFLLSHPVGLTCLAVGLALIFLGLTWIERLASTALS